MISSSVVTVTPEMAKIWLDTANVNNRTIRDSVAERYARDMVKGNWGITSDAIAFAEDGTLLNGQHRLTAVVKANIPVDMLITRDLPKSAVVGIDQGLRRSFNDNLKMSVGNIPDAFQSQKIVAAIRSLAYMELDMTLTHSEILFLYKNLKSTFDTLDRIIRNKRQKAPMPPAFSAAVVAALLGGEDVEGIEAFLFTYANYENSSDYNIQIALNWRNYLDDAKARKLNVSRTNIYRGTQNAIYNYLHSDVRQNRIPNKGRYEIRDKLVTAVQGGTAA